MRTLSCATVVALLAGCSGTGTPPATAVGIAGRNETARPRVAASHVTPFVNVELAGNVAAPSVLVKCTVASWLLIQ